MDTKFRRVRYSLYTKVAIFIAIILIMAFSATTFVNTLIKIDTVESLFKDNYFESEEFSHCMDDSFSMSFNLAYSNDENAVRKYLNSMDLYGEFRYEKHIDDMKSILDEEELDKKYQEFFEEKVKYELSQFKTIKNSLNNLDGILYYISYGDKEFSNCEMKYENEFRKYSVYIIFNKDEFDVNPASIGRDIYNMYNDSLDYEKLKINIAMDNEYLQKKLSVWKSDHEILASVFTMIIFGTVFSLILLIYLICVIGKKTKDSKVQLSVFDRLFTDVNIIAIGIIVKLWLTGLSTYAHTVYTNKLVTQFANINYLFILVFLFHIILCSVLLSLFLSLIKHIKNRTLMKSTFVFWIIENCLKILGYIFKKGILVKKLLFIMILWEGLVFFLTVIMVVENSTLSFLFLVLLLVLSALVLYYLVKMFSPLNLIIEEVKKIKNGNFDYKINIKEMGAFENFSQDINDISEGLKEALQREVKAEKMKAELVTNVSHDLKTPLTAINNYTNLLHEENLSPSKANEYVNVLKQKVEKLNKLTIDLFELASLQSGNINLEKERINISVLIKQSLGEFENSIKESNLDFKLDLNEKDAYITGDGKKLSRVFENLILNIVKYSLKNTRVYINTLVENEKVYVVFKNIANYCMDFSEEEIMERFVRGDKARTTNGNGLGLAIAKSYIEACEGSIKIEIDGDLFKVTIAFPRS